MPFAFFHGIAQEGRSSDALRKLWIDSLDVGLDQARSLVSLHNAFVTVPFYGDLLAGGSKREIEATQRVDQDRTYRSGEALWPISAANQIEKEFLSEISRTRSRRIDKDKIDRSFGSGMLRALSSVLPDAAQARLVDFAIEQVAVYLTSPDIRKHISGLADAALIEIEQAGPKSDDRLVVVGHSLGSIVAIEALWRWTGKPIDLLVTIGSPLSVGCINSRLTLQSPRWPQKLRNWVNVADREDVVALHGAIDRTNFFSSCTAADKTERADVLNILDVPNHMDNHHGIAGYLDDPVVARIVALFPE